MINSPNASTEYNYRYFDVDFLRDNNDIGSIVYYNCEILSYVVDTLDSGDFESYTLKSGFAITDQIEFRCGGLNSNNPTNMAMYEDTHTDYATVCL